MVGDGVFLLCEIYLIVKNVFIKWFI
jgi:hypothetical protein